MENNLYLETANILQKYYDDLENMGITDKEFTARQRIISLCINIAIEYGEDIGLNVEIV